MKRRTWVLTVVIVAVFLAGGAAVAALNIGGVVGGGGVARPPCGKLPDKAAVLTALHTHPDMIKRLENVGNGVRVNLAQPCDDANLGLVRVTYTNDSQRDAIDTVLQHEDGFGVPLEVMGS